MDQKQKNIEGHMKSNKYGFSTLDYEDMEREIKGQNYILEYTRTFL